MPSEKELREWKREKRLIPVMIREYCHHYHHTHGKEVCPECQELTDYALLRLDKCPFKVNKGFCSFCKIHCYQKEMKEKIRKVMRYSGPRMVFTHPIYAFSHVAQMIRYKRAQSKGGTPDAR